MIEKAKDLNAKYIRFDLWWKDVNLRRISSTKMHLNTISYKAIINKIHQEGMDVIVILGSSGGFPSWVNNLLEDAGTGYYATKVNGKDVKIPTGRVNVKSLGYLITYYQLELNHPADPIQMWDDPQYIKALYDGISEHDYYFKTIVNAFADWAQWDYWLKYWLNSVGNCIDIVAIDHYPGTWAYESYDHWNELDTLFSIAD